MENENKRLSWYLGGVNGLDVALTLSHKDSGEGFVECGRAAANFVSPEGIDFTEATLAKTALIAGVIGATTLMAKIGRLKTPLPFAREIELDYVTRKALKISTAFCIGIVAWNELNILLDRNAEQVTRFFFESGLMNFLINSGAGKAINDLITSNCS